MRLVVIGADGFLGSRLCDALSSSGREVLRVGRHGAGPDRLGADLTKSADVARLVEEARDAVVIYCANVGGRAQADAAPQAAAEVNGRVPGQLAAVARGFTYISTDYVFSREGSTATTETPPNPDTVYGRTKLAGERAVLAVQSNATVVRTSGLFDEFGTRTTTFRGASRTDVADNSVSTPTAVADVVQTCSELIDHGGPPMIHCVGPHALTPYEFHVLAALRWHFDVVPTLSPTPRTRVLQPTTPKMRSVAQVLLAPLRPRVVNQPRVRRCVVFDTVGVVLGGRRWMHPEDAFWQRQAALVDRTSDSLTVSEIAETAEAYTFNPALPRLWWRYSQNDTRVLANNGPSATFEQWVRRFDLDALFDLTLNSERDGLRKPSSAFFSRVLKATGARCGSIVDDRPDVVDAARTAGWETLLTRRRPSGLVDCFDFETRTSAAEEDPCD